MVGLLTANEIAGSADRQRTTTFAVRAEANAESLARVIGLFAQRGIFPEQLCCRHATPWLIIDFAVAELDAQTTEILLQKLRAVVAVNRAVVVGNGT